MIAIVLATSHVLCSSRTLQKVAHLSKDIFCGGIARSSCFVVCLTNCVTNHCRVTARAVQSSVELQCAQPCCCTCSTVHGVETQTIYSQQATELHKILARAAHAGPSI